MSAANGVHQGTLWGKGLTAIATASARMGPAWVIVATLSVAALALRLPGIHQDLFGDELFTFDDVYGRSLPDMVDRVRTGYEDNPPLFFMLAWGAAKLGDPTLLVRLPSLLLGTALVPLVYVLGVRTVGRRAALVAAAIVALSPFTVFYGSEARAYAMLMFLVSVSTLALLNAAEGRGWGWWPAYGVAACAVLYTHYTGGFVVLAQAGWAAWHCRDQRREVVLVNAGVLLGYLPWLVTQITKEPTYTKLADLSPSYFVTTLGHVLPGHPLETLREVPGTPLALFFACLLFLALLSGAFRAGGLRAGTPLPTRPVAVLLAATALATPGGIALVSFGQHNILLPRSLAASLPAAVLLVGWLLTSPKRPAATVATAAALAVIAIGTVETLDGSVRGSHLREAARYIEEHSRPRDSVVHRTFYHRPPHPLADFLAAYLKGTGIPVFALDVNDSPAWQSAAEGGRVLFVYQPFTVFGRRLRLEPQAGPGRCFRLESRKVISEAVTIGVYSLPAESRRCAHSALLERGR
jgi:hypothetical protein